MAAFPTPYPNPDDGPAARHLPSTITAEEHVGIPGEGFRRAAGRSHGAGQKISGQSGLDPCTRWHHIGAVRCVAPEGEAANGIVSGRCGNPASCLLNAFCGCLTVVFGRGRCY